MDDTRLVEAVAREFIERHGQAAIAILCEQAEIASSLGDSASAQSWRDIAQVARRQVRVGATVRRTRTAATSAVRRAA